MLAAGALVASLLAVGAAPAAAAEPDNADYPADTSACVGDALDDHMFTDVGADHFHADAINCIAYYGITNGTGDGSTYSPNAGVTRAQMAVFIARAAGVAGVDLDDPMGDAFTDIDDTWSDAQDAINSLAESGIIASGGAFRPDDGITRAEMATFLVGMLAQAADVVTISNGEIMLGTLSAKEGPTDFDYFADARATLPRANDSEVSALFELGVTKGASAAAGAEEGKAPLDFNYEPHGTVTRGQMAAFITRALAHTSARPVGVSAQYAGSDVVVSVRDDDFQPRPNVVVDLFETDTGGVDLAFGADGACAEVVTVAGSSGALCEIDGADPITGGDGDAREALGGVDSGGTTVWAWTGNQDDTVDSDTDLYRLDISETDEMSMASKASFTTDFAGSKQKLGSSVVYALQLHDARGEVAVGADGKKPASYGVVLTTHRYEADGSIVESDALSVVPMTLTTDSDGEALLTVSAPSKDRNKDAKVDKYRVTVTIAAGVNAPAGIEDAGGDAIGAGVVVVFSTETGVVEVADIKVSVKPAAMFVAASARGASNRATVTVTDQYGAPITGVRVSLSSDALATDDSIGGNRMFAVGRDGSYTFGYTRKVAAGATETLTAVVSGYDHDGDGCTAALIGTDLHRCNPGGTPPLVATGGQLTTTLQWAEAASADSTDAAQIRAFDTETNTIFAGGDGSVMVIRYDSNDRFDIDRNGSADPAAAASSYAVFEKNLSKDTGYMLTWDFAGDGPGNSRAVNLYTLTTPAS